MKSKVILFSLLLCIFLTPTSYAQKEGTADYDVLIKNGKVFEGSLKPAFESDVAVKDGKIVRVAQKIEGTAARTIDAKGLHVSPGFIDLHTHVDRGLYFPENRACLNYLLQGVTTVIVGQCGSSGWPIFEKAEDQMKRWSEEGIGPSAALLVGHGSVRQIVMGMENREPTPEELEEMKALVEEAMEQGAHGISTGLIYAPGSYGKTDEVVELVKVIVPYGGIYHSHIRNERDSLLEAVGELIEISEETGAQAHISHFKVMGRNNWGLVKKACTMIEEARARGLRITADQYPYQFSSNYPYVRLIPRSAWRGEEAVERLTREDVENIFNYLRDDELIELYTKVTPYIPLSERHRQFLAELPRKRLVSFVARSLLNPGNFQGPENTRERMLFLERMGIPVEAEKIRKEVREDIENTVGPENILIALCVEKELEGKSLGQISKLRGKSVEDVAIELELMGAKAIPLQMCEEDIEYIMKKDYVGTGSDGTTPFFGIGLPHIRSYSTFLHKIKKYGLQRRAVSLAHVIRSQTSLPAEIMNWKDRGWIKNSYRADIVVLDLDDIHLKTSISNPHQYSEGVKYLLVNGKVVIDEGEWNGTLAGEVITLNK
jgi:N-acyl-D-aspartate/D-glutamate deacylase